MSTRSTATVSRRGFLAFGGSAAAVGAVAATGVGRAIGTAPEPLRPPAGLPTGAVDFHGLHQAGIAEPAPGHALLTAYDADAGLGRGELAEVFKAWTTAARDLTAGRPTADDPMIGTDAGASALTITLGVGKALLDRLGIASPAALADLPEFAGDEIEAGRSDGDLVVQICAEDPFAVAAADRVLRRLAAANLSVRWQETGFQGDAGRAKGHNTRNLMGQIDGTNSATTSPLARSGPVWVDGDEPAWMTGGSYLVVRRIRMLLDTWEEVPVADQERVIGRHKVSGAPLGSRRESDPVDLEAVGPDGGLLIPEHSHVRLSTPDKDKGEEMRRRGFSYRGGILPNGSTDQGLLFLAYVKDPTASFVPVQQRLAAHDALNEFTVTTGSALFAILPGIADEDDWLGSKLLS